MIALNDKRVEKILNEFQYGANKYMPWGTLGVSMCERDSGLLSLETCLHRELLKLGFYRVMPLITLPPCHDLALERAVELPKSQACRLMMGVMIDTMLKYQEEQSGKPKIGLSIMDILKQEKIEIPRSWIRREK